MPPAEPRPNGHHGHITKPRPSLSCIVCRRRKVRCGREQPICSNCGRIQETCEYETDVRDRSTPQAKRKLKRGPPNADIGTSKPASRLLEEPWSEWPGQEDSPIHFNEAGYLARPITTTSDQFSSASSSNYRRGSSIQSSNSTSC